MKKILLCSGLWVGLAFGVSAQTIFSEDFETSKKTIPAGWSQQNPAAIPTNKGWFFDTLFGGIMGNYVPKHTYYAFVNDYDNNSSNALNKDTLYTPILNLTAYTHVFITYDVWYYGGFIANPGDFEIASLAASSDGGKTWTQVDTVGCWEKSQWRTRLYDLSAYGGKANVMFAFTYTDLGNDANGEAIDNVRIFVPILYDVGVTQDNMIYLCQTGNSYSVTGVLRNYGGDTVNSMHLNYTVNGGPAITDNITSLAIAPLTNYTFTHSILWTPATAGNYVIKIWADNLNGSNVDVNHANDTLTAYFIVMDTLQTKMPLFEEFMQASCDPCMHATPNLDSVLFNNRNICNPLRYHVSWPGRDFINMVTEKADISPRVDYYGIQGVPDARIDGITDVYPGSVSSADIQMAASVGSPFSITLTSSFNPLSNAYNVTANITAHAALPGGIRARAVLTVDTIKYHQDQSQEDPPSSFAPPIGTGTTSDSFYPYVVNYPEVVEDVMPDSNGVRLGAFITGQTQVVNYSWTKNHAWGDSNKVWLYDSLSTHITVFVQNDSTPAAGGGAPTQYVYQSATGSVITGLQNMAEQETYFEMYPNPTSNNVTLVFRLADIHHVSIEVYSMLGEKVYSIDKGRTPAGLHNIQLSTEGLNSGIYFVRLSTEEGTNTEKLVIQK